MKFLLVNKYLYIRGGTETYLFNLAESLKERGHSICFFGMADPRNIVPDSDGCFINNADFYVKHSIFEKARILSSFAYSREAKNKLNHLIEIEHPDVAVVGLVHGNITFSIFEVLHERGITSIYVNHDYHNSCPASTFFRSGSVCTECRDNHFSHCIVHRCIKNSFLLSFFCAKENYLMYKKGLSNLVDIYISPTNFMRENLAIPSPNDARNHVLYNYLPDSFFQRVETINRGFYFLYYGRLAKEKGIDLLIDSFARAFKGRPSHLIIAGRGPEESALRQRAKMSGASSHIYFVGFQSGEALKKLILHSSFVVYPSKWYENCPYSVIESLGLKKPVIISNNGGMPELISDKVSGFLFDTKVAHSLDDVLIYAERMDKAAYDAMCNAAYLSAKTKFSEDQYLENFFQLLERK